MGYFIVQECSHCLTKKTSSFQIIIEVDSLLQFYKEVSKLKLIRCLELIIRKSIAWGFFDGAYQFPSQIWCWVHLPISNSPYLQVKANLGRGTNNVGELTTLLLLLQTDRGTFQICGLVLNLIIVQEEKQQQYCAILQLLTYFIFMVKCRMRDCRR